MLYNVCVWMWKHVMEERPTQEVTPPCKDAQNPPKYPRLAEVRRERAAAHIASPFAPSQKPPLFLAVSSQRVS